MKHLVLEDVDHHLELTKIRFLLNLPNFILPLSLDWRLVKVIKLIVQDLSLLLNGMRMNGGVMEVILRGMKLM